MSQVLPVQSIASKDYFAVSMRLQVEAKDILRNQSCFAQHCSKHSEVDGCSPNPLSGIPSRYEYQTAPEDHHGSGIDNLQICKPDVQRHDKFAYDRVV